MKRRRTTRRRPGTLPLSADRRIIPLGQKPIRAEAERACRLAMRAVARLREKIARHHSLHAPAYERWLRAEFGKQLDEEAVIEARIAELEDLTAEVAMLKFWSDCSDREAYEQVQRARQRMESAEPPPEDGNDEEAAAADADDDEFSEEERLFRAFLRQSLGEDPDTIPRRQYRQFFREFREAAKAHDGIHWTPPGRPPHSARASSQIKDLYRILVRKLHPDSGADYDGESKRLWHDLQEAYKNHDLERMEILLALTEIHDGTDPPRTTIFHIRKVTAEFQRSAQDLRSQVRKLTLSPAGRFAAARDRGAFTSQFREKLLRRLASARAHLSQLESLITSWTHPRKRKSPRPHRQTDKAGQQKFSFVDS